MVLALLTVILLLTVWQIRFVLLGVFAGGLVALFVYQPSTLIARALNLPRRPVTVAVFLSLIAASIAVLGLFGQQIAGQIEQLVATLPEATERIQEILDRLGLGRLARLPIGQEGTSAVLGGAGWVLSGGVSALVYGALILFTSLFLALDPQGYREGLLRVVPLERRERLRDVIDECAATLGRWLIGQFIVMLTIGVAVALGLTALGTPLATVLGLMAGLLEFVPILGPVAAAVPAILIALTQGLWMTLYVVLFYIAINQLEGNLLVPIIQQQRVSLPPLMTLAGAIVMSALFGFAGLVLAVPLIVVARVLIIRLWVEDFLGDTSLLPTAEREPSPQVGRNSGAPRSL